MLLQLPSFLIDTPNDRKHVKAPKLTRRQLAKYRNRQGRAIEETVGLYADRRNGGAVQGRCIIEGPLDALEPEQSDRHEAKEGFLAQRHGDRSCSNRGH